jgi:glycosyltransferase involved in cell wall biosynthesis
MSAPGVFFKKLTGVSLYTWVLDLWPESLEVVGGVRNKYILRFFDFFVKKEYEYSDKILISSRSFRESVLKYGDYQSKILYFPQWADINDGEIVAPNVSPVIPEGFKIMFAGAVGEAHGFENIMHAALLTKDYQNIKWIIVGEGRKYDWVKRYVSEHQLQETVILLGRYPKETMSWFFDKADVMLVSLNDNPLFKLYAPAKISTYMAAGKPILAILEGEGADIINEAECGWTFSPNNLIDLANKIIELLNTNKIEILEKGRNSRSYYNYYFKKDNCLLVLDKMLFSTVTISR